MQIFVLGMHRSGTSAVARTLNLMGVYFGGENVSTGRNSENEKGFWERRDVRDLSDTILFNSECDWDCVTNFSLDAVPADVRASYADAAADIVLNMDAHRPWFIKEPRLCLLFPIWRDSLENPLCIHVLRNPLEVAHSLKVRNKIPIRVGLALWEVYTLRSMEASAGVPRAFVSYGKLMNDPPSTVQSLHSALDAGGAFALRTPSDDELSRFLDARLYRQRKTERALKSVATSTQWELHKLLLSSGVDRDLDDLPAVSESSIEVLRQYEASIDVGDRIVDANRRQSRRRPASLESQISLKNLELDHARTLMSDVSSRLNAVELEARELRRVESEKKVALALSGQKSDFLSGELAALRNSRDRLEEEASTLKDLNGELERSRVALERESTSLARDKTALVQELEVLRESNSELKTKATDLEVGRAELEEASGALRHDNEALHLERTVLRDANADLEGKRADLEQAHAGLKVDNEALHLERTVLRDANADLEGKRADLEQAHAGLKVDNEALRLERTVLRDANADLEGKRAYLEQAHAGLKVDNEALRLERTVLRDANADLEGKRADLEQAHAGLKVDNEALRLERTVLRDANADLEGKRADLEQAHAGLKVDNEALHLERTVLRDANADLEGKRADLEQAHAGLKVDNEALRLERTVLRDANADLEGKRAYLEQAHAGLKVDNEALRLERTVLRDANADLEGKRADLEQAHAGLKVDNEALRLERTVLRDANADLEGKRADLEQAHAGLKVDNEALRLERTVLRDANADLERKRADLEQANARVEENLNEFEEAKVLLDRQIAELQQTHRRVLWKIDRGADDVSRRRARARDTVVLWDRELSRRKDVIARLSRLAEALRTDIGNLLGSRRWRLGRTIVSSLYLLSFRGIPRDAGERLAVAGIEHQAKAQLIGDFATSRDKVPDSVSELVPTATSTVDDILGSASHRHGEIARQLLERGLELRRRSRQIQELSEYVEALSSAFEAIAESRRWRLGDFLISAPYRLLRGGTPPTAVDSATSLVREFRAGTYTREADRPVLPTPAEMEPLKERAVSDLENIEEVNGPGSEVGRVDDGHEQTLVSDTEPVQWVGLGREVRRPARPALPEVSVDVVICVHNALEDVKRCVASVLSRTAIDHRVIVVNDGSGMETTAWLRRFAARHSVVHLVETDGPLGYTRAANRGLRASSSANVVLLNSDTVVPRLWLAGMLECLHSDDKLGIVGPLSNAASWQSVPERFGEDGGWAINDLPPGYNVDEYAELVYRASDFVFPRVGFLNGFCLLIRREVIEAIGYLDEESFPRGYGEENDYCIRARAAGFELAIADQCFVFHAKSRSFGHKARHGLAEEGKKALRIKYGNAAIDEGTRELNNSPCLARIRSRLSPLGDAAPVEPPGVSPSGGIRGEHTGIRVLYVLPVRGGSGGANSVVQEVAGMRSLGVEASVAIESRHAESMHWFYGDILDAHSRVVFASNEELVSVAESFDVVVATLWSTPELIAPIAERWPEKAFAYYVQDYEPWFFPHDDDAREKALASYTRVPNMILMAKTDWICRTVRARHGVEVFRVAPSLDHGVFYPNRTLERKDGIVTVSAMVRPSTPRRAPLRTVRVLGTVARQYDHVRVLLFGCESHVLESYVREHAPNLRLDFEFENRGILTRHDVADLLRESDVFVDLSDYQAFGRTGLEAMACGCATVLPARGGVDEYVVDGENACLVDTTSLEAMTATVARLVADRSLREGIQGRSLYTAARYSIERASLSELSVFRWIWTTHDGNSCGRDSYRRGIEPVSTDVERISVVVHVGFDGFDGVADDATQQRVLWPLKQPALCNTISLHEVQSTAGIRQHRPDICVVHNGLGASARDAEEFVTACRDANSVLIYSVDADGRRLFESEPDSAVRVLAGAADRIVAPTQAIADSLASASGHLFVVPAALDETNWLDRSVLGERKLPHREATDTLRVLFLGNHHELAGVLPALIEINKTGERVAVTAVGDYPSTLPGFVEPVHRREHGYDDFVCGLRARNQWDVAVMPVTETTVDADLRFLGLSALRLAIVCSDRGDHLRFARDAENALLVPNTRTGWVAGLTQVLSDPGLRERLGDQAAYDAENRHGLRLSRASVHRAYIELNGTE